MNLLTVNLNDQPIGRNIICRDSGIHIGIDKQLMNIWIFSVKNSRSFAEFFED